MVINETIIEYRMMGTLINSNPPWEAVYWTVYNSPDLTGQYSGYFGQLINISVVATYPISGPPNTLNPPVGPAGGDLSGTYPNPIVVGINGTPILRTPGPSDGQVLTYVAADGYVEWKNAASSSTSYTTVSASGPSTVNAVAGQLVLANSSGGNITVNTPTTVSLPVGTFFGVSDVAGSAAAHPITVIGANSSTLENPDNPTVAAINNSVTVDTPLQTVWWVWTGSIWKIAQVSVPLGRSNILVFQPGGTITRNVLTDWVSLYHAINQVNGPVTVVLDTSFSSTFTVPAGTYTFQNSYLSIEAAGGGGPPSLALQTGVIWNGLTSIHLKGANLLNFSTSTIPITFNTAGLFTCILENNSFISNTTAGTQPVITVTNNTSSSLDLWLYNSTIGGYPGATGPSVTVTGPTASTDSLQVLMVEASTVRSGAVTSSQPHGGTVICSSDASIVFPSTYTNIDFEIESVATLVNYNDGYISSPTWNVSTVQQGLDYLKLQTINNVQQATGPVTVFAAPGQLVLCNSTSGAITVNMPIATGVPLGTYVGIADGYATSATHNITINGSNPDGYLESPTVPGSYAISQTISVNSQVLWYVFAGNDWKLVMEDSASTADTDFYQTVEVAGTPVTQRAKLNFANGGNVTITPTDNGSDTTTLTLSVPSIPTIFYQTVEANGSPASPQRAKVNFVNSGGMTITTSDNGSDTTNVNLEVTAYRTVQNNGTPVATEPALNFVNFDLTDSSGTSTNVTRPLAIAMMYENGSTTQSTFTNGTLVKFHAASFQGGTNISGNTTTGLMTINSGYVTGAYILRASLGIIMTSEAVATTQFQIGFVINDTGGFVGPTKVIEINNTGLVDMTLECFPLTLAATQTISLYGLQSSGSDVTININGTWMMERVL